VQLSNAPEVGGCQGGQKGKKAIPDLLNLQVEMTQRLHRHVSNKKVFNGW